MLTDAGAPFSELKGRRMPLLLGMFGFSVFQVAVAAAKDMQTVLVARFFGGVFASCPIAVVGAVFADMFAPQTRASAVALFSMAVFSGPLFGPIAGAFLVDGRAALGWRWTEHLTALMGFAGLALCLGLLQETYPPVLLVSKAAHLRRITQKYPTLPSFPSLSLPSPSFFLSSLSLDGGWVAER